jgi:hypothetical protein
VLLVVAGKTAEWWVNLFLNNFINLVNFPLTCHKIDEDSRCLDDR